MLCLDVIFRYMMVLFGFILSSLKINYLSSSVSNSLPIGGGGVLPIMAYMGRLRLKGVPLFEA